MNATATSIVAPSRPRVWMSIALAGLLILSMLASAIGVRTASAQDSQEGLASAVPADTVMYIGLDLDQESDQWVQTYALLERAGLSDLAEDELGTSTEELGDLAESSNVTGAGAIVFTDAESLVSYSSTDITGTAIDTTMDVAPEEVPDVPEGFALILQPEDPAALAEEFVTMVVDEADANSGIVETVDYNGVTITYWTPADPTITGTATAEVDGTVVLSTRPSDIEPIIDTVQGTGESLADTDGFADVASRLQADPIVFGYFNLDVLMTAVQNDESYAEISGQLGAAEELDAAKGHAGWAVYASDAGFHVDSTFVPNDPSLIVDGGSFTPSLASKVPADVLLFGNANNLYGTGISDILGQLFQTALSESSTPSATGVGETATPDVAAATPTVDETWAYFEQALGFNPDTDLLQKLDGEYAVFAGIYGLESGIPDPQFLFVSGTSDAATLENTSTTVTNIVNMLAQDGGYTVSSRQVDGGELTSITIDAETTGLIPLTIEFGVVGDELLIGTSGAVDLYLDASSEKLADDANFQATFAELPSENLSSISYVNVQGQVLPLLDWLVTILNTSMTTLDNNEDCAEYGTQAEAQTAYDADPSDLWLLDMDYDGDACEDFFGEATAVASPESISDQVNVLSFGSVSWTDGEALYTSSILLIGD